MTRPTRSHRARALAVAGLLVAGLGATVLTAPAAGAQSAVLQPGETASSGMTLLANLPKSGAFAPEGAFNSDLAFSGKTVYAGNYNGFTVYDVKQANKPREVKQVLCPGSQNDISVYGNLLVLSVDSLRSDDTCTSTQLTTTQAAATGTGYWEGLRIFDISDPANPQYVKAVETDCGSHTHTLVPGAEGTVYAYVSSYSPNAALADCQPPHDKISVVKIPLANPTAAAVVAEPVLFPDGGLVARTQGCHDITAYPAKGIAAGACMGEGVLMNIKDPANPVITERVADTENFAFWHSATFSNEADTVMFTDELGGGGGPTCNPTVGPNKGADAFYTLGQDGQLTFQSYYKIAREQSNTENCVAHNGSLLPVKTGQDMMVQAWYQGGISVIDFTDPKNVRELAWFDRGPLSNERLILGGSWSAYYHDGYVFSNDIQKGLDVFEITAEEAGSARSVRNKTGDYNVQSQPQF